METLPTSLKTLLELLGGSLGIYLSVRIMEAIKLSSWSIDRCTWTGIFIAAILGVAAWVGGCVMGYNQFPATTGDFWWRAWVEVIVGVGLVSGVAAKAYYDQIYHPLDKKSG